MDWQSHKAAAYAVALLLCCCATASPAWGWSERTAAGSSQNLGSPYLEMVICPLRAEPWSCARQQAGRLLNVWDSEVHLQWRKLQDEADRQLNATLEKRGYSMSEPITKEKPSTTLKKIEIATKYMKEYLAETMDGFLGREFEYQQSANLLPEDYSDRDANTGPEDEEEDEEDHDEDDEEADKENAYEDIAVEPTSGDSKNSNGVTDEGVEFFEIGSDDDEAATSVTGQLKRPSGGGNKKRKNKKGQQAATLVLVQEAAHPVESVGSGHGHGGGGGGGRPSKKKRQKNKNKNKNKKRKHQGGGEVATVVVEEHTGTGHLGLDLLDELVHADDAFGGAGKRKQKHPSKYGRSNGVTRGKKKKKRKALAKLVILGTFLKAKIELLLKILGAHLQIKFFAIALIGLLINIARFWIDVKRGGVPQKVVYVEHAHHQHHYEEHGDEWNEPTSYWKRRSMTNESTEDVDDAASDPNVPPQQQAQSQYNRQQYNPSYLAYRGWK